MYKTNEIKPTERPAHLSYDLKYYFLVLDGRPLRIFRFSLLRCAFHNPNLSLSLSLLSPLLHLLFFASPPPRPRLLSPNWPCVSYTFVGLSPPTPHSPSSSFFYSWEDLPDRLPLPLLFASRPCGIFAEFSVCRALATEIHRTSTSFAAATVSRHVLSRLLPAFCLLCPRTGSNGSHSARCLFLPPPSRLWLQLISDALPQCAWIRTPEADNTETIDFVGCTNLLQIPIPPIVPSCIDGRDLAVPYIVDARFLSSGLVSDLGFARLSPLSRLGHFESEPTSLSLVPMSSA